jgi:hypothetical protein
MGKTVTSGLLNDVLNQTYPLLLEDKVSSGMYIVRVRIDNDYFSTKIILSK